MVEEIEDKQEGDQTRERGWEYLSQRDKGLPLHRGETDMAHSQMTGYKGKMGNPVLR